MNDLQGPKGGRDDFQLGELKRLQGVVSLDRRTLIG